MVESSGTVSSSAIRTKDRIDKLSLARQRCHAPNRCLRSRPSATESRCQAPGLAVPWLRHRTAGRDLLRNRQSSSRPAPGSSVHKMDDSPTSVATPLASTIPPAAPASVAVPSPCTVDVHNILNVTCFRANLHHALLGGKGSVGCLSRSLPPAGQTPVAMLRQGSPREIRISKSRSGM
jgi:hypothetical protein